jgi:hypothetical protein
MTLYYHLTVVGMTEHATAPLPIVFHSLAHKIERQTGEQ